MTTATRGQRIIICFVGPFRLATFCYQLIIGTKRYPSSPTRLVPSAYSACYFIFSTAIDFLLELKVLVIFCICSRSHAGNINC